MGPSPAAGIQLPWEPPEPTATPPSQASKAEGPPPAQSQPKETAPGQPSQPPQRTPLPEPPPPSQAAADLNKEIANNYWQHLWENMKNSPFISTVAAGFAVGGPAFAAGFALARSVPW